MALSISGLATTETWNLRDECDLKKKKKNSRVSEIKLQQVGEWGQEARKTDPFTAAGADKGRSCA